MDLFFSLVIFTFSQLHVTHHVRLILCHFILTHALLLNLCIHAFPTPFLCGTLFPLILLILMYHNLKMLYEATLCNLCSILVLYIVSYCSYYSPFFFFFFFPGCTYTSFCYLHTPALANLSKKNTKKKHNKPWGTRGAMQPFPFLLEPNRHSRWFSTSDKQFLREVPAQHSQLATLETRLENAAN